MKRNELTEFHEAIDGLAGAELGAGSALIAEITTLLEAKDRLEAQLARRIAAAERSGAFAHDGHPTMTAWLRDLADMSHRTARKLVAVARQADAMPCVREGWRAGTIGTAKVEVLAAMRGRDPLSEELFEPLEPTVAAVCQSGRLEDLLEWRGRFLQLHHMRLMQRDDRDEPDPDPVNRLHAAKTFENTLVLDGVFDAELGSTIDRALHVEMERMRTEGDLLTASNRRGLALASICSQYLAQQFKAGHSEAHVVVHVDARTASGMHLGLARSESGLDVEMAVAQTMLCTSTISRLLIGQDGVALDHGRAIRLFTSAQKRAIRAMFPTCVWGGCTVVAADCHTHHVHHWDVGGETNLGNGVPLCRRHHRFVHRHPEIRFVSELGVCHWTIRRPDGTVLAAVRPRRTPAAIRLQRDADHLASANRARLYDLLER